VEAVLLRGSILLFCFLFRGSSIYSSSAYYVRTRASLSYFLKTHHEFGTGFSVTDRKSALVPMQSDSAGMRQLALRPSVSGRTEMVDNPLAARSYENTRPFAF
jgi:hypothetical protein